MTLVLKGLRTHDPPQHVPYVPSGSGLGGDARAMHNTYEHDPTKHPLMRITTLGEFALERLVRTPVRALDEPPRYVLVSQSEWSNRGPAMALLEAPLCRPNPPASRDEVLADIFSDHQ